MPRVTSTEQYRRYKFLHIAWQEFMILYSAIDSAKQGDLHDFYQPSKTLTEAELVRHMKTAGRVDRSLPQRAGTYAGLLERLFLDGSRHHGVSSAKAHSTIETVYQTKYDSRLLAKPIVTEPYHLGGRKESTRLRVSGVIRPDPDLEAMTKVLMEHYLSGGEDKTV